MTIDTYLTLRPGLYTKYGGTPLDFSDSQIPLPHMDSTFRDLELGLGHVN